MRSAKIGAGAILALSLLWAPVARADGMFFGLDTAGGTFGAIGGVSRGKLSFGASYTNYGSGQSASLSLSRSLPFDLGIEGLHFGVGAVLGLRGGDLSEPSLGISASAARYHVTDFGSTLLQLSVNPVSRSYFAQGQVSFREPGLSIGLARGASPAYEQTSLSISKRLGTSPVSVRAGYRFVSEEWFVGFGFSTF